MIRCAGLLLASGAVLVLVEVALPHHGLFPAGITLALAFVGCLGLVGVARLLGDALGLQRPEPPPEPDD